jgi:acyl-coenzyme A synthetase/AMP-(fatty) acid ligase
VQLGADHQGPDRDGRAAEPGRLRARPGRRAKVALRWLGRRGQLRELTHADLAAVSKRCANMLAGPGIGAGERVFACCERVPGGPAAIYGAHALEALRQFEQRA